MAKAIAKSATKSVSVVGEVTHCDLRIQRPFRCSPYFPGEQKEVVCVIGIRDDEGKDFWFYTTPASFNIGGGGGFYVAIVTPNDWVTTKEWDVKGALGARGMGDSPVARVKVGDRVSIVGNVKAEVTRFGVMLNRVRREDYSHRAEQAKWLKRKLAAEKTLNVTDRGDWSEGAVLPEGVRDLENPWVGMDEPEAIPGVTWQGIGWCGRIWRYQAKVVDYRALVAAAEGVDIATVIEPN